MKMDVLNVILVDILHVKMILKIKKIYEDSIIPRYAHNYDAGLDLYSYESYLLKPLERITVKTGISMEIPQGYFGSIRDRSGLASKKGVHTLAGVVDSNYRGEIGIVIINLGNENLEINKGDKIAQILIQKVETPEIEEVNELNKSNRGERGFGSTGN